MNDCMVSVASSQKPVGEPDLLLAEESDRMRGFADLKEVSCTLLDIIPRHVYLIWSSHVLIKDALGNGHQCRMSHPPAA